MARFFICRYEPTVLNVCKNRSESAGCEKVTVPRDEPTKKTSKMPQQYHPYLVISNVREKSIFCLFFPDITEFALRKSIVRALKIFHGLG